MVRYSSCQPKERSLTKLAQLLVDSACLWESWLDWIRQDTKENGHAEEYDLALVRVEAVASKTDEELAVLACTHCEGLDEVLNLLRPTADGELDSDEWHDRVTEACEDNGGDRYGLDWISESAWRIALFLQALRGCDRKRAAEAEASLLEAVGGLASEMA